jgi:hypothetical protein
MFTPLDGPLNLAGSASILDPAIGSTINASLRTCVSPRGASIFDHGAHIYPHQRPRRLALLIGRPRQALARRVFGHVRGSLLGSSIRVA